MARPYTCSKCGEKFLREDKKACPLCGEPVVLRSHNRRPKVERPTQEPILETFDKVWNTAEFSARILFDGARYTVQFAQGTVVKGWIYCPNDQCHRKLYQNTRLNGSFDTRCPSCKADITFIF